jgi:euchromatic histone-lysine N-methyltransferase
MNVGIGMYIHNIKLMFMYLYRFLMSKRADPLIRDSEQNIALHWSTFSGSVDISELLLNYGCNVNATNAQGDTPL